MARKYTDFLDQQILNKYLKDNEIPTPEGIGNPANLTTTSKDNLVNAVNEVKSDLSSHNHNASYLGITANAITASKLANPRTISLTGDVTGSTSFDGSNNVNIITTVSNSFDLSDFKYANIEPLNDEENIDFGHPFKLSPFFGVNLVNTRVQIATDINFTNLVFNSTVQLNNNIFYLIANLNPSTKYYWRFAYVDSVYGLSQYSDYSSFITVSNYAFNPTIGDSIGGGYFAGYIDTTSTGGLRYALIISPKAGGENSSLKWKFENTSTLGTDSIWDGWTNTNNMNDSDHPAAQWTRQLNINGYDDWYFPAKDELELLYRNLKSTTQNNNTSSGANTSSDPIASNYTSSNPSQTSVIIFQSGQSEEFTINTYWSSTEHNDSSGCFQFFANGNQGNFNKNANFIVRAVRRLIL